MAVLVRLGEAGMGVMRYGGVCRAMAAPERRAMSRPVATPHERTRKNLAAPDGKGGVCDAK